MSKAVEYFENIQKIMSRIMTEQMDNIEKAARAVADALENGGRVHAFGTGHSHMLAEEIFYRAGGLVNVNPILESGLMLHESASKSTALERLEGYGEIIFDFNNINEKDVLFLFSNSGRNGVAIDLALIAKEKGVKTVVITNMLHTMQGKSRHSSGKKLYEAGEIVMLGVKKPKKVQKALRQMIAMACTRTANMMSPYKMYPQMYRHVLGGYPAYYYGTMYGQNTKK